VQRAGVYHGSLLYLQLDVPEDLAATDPQADCSITLEANDWTIYHNEVAVADSDSVTRDFAETSLTQMLRGHPLVTFDVDSVAATILIGGGFLIRLFYGQSCGEGYDRIFTIYLLHGQSVCLEGPPPEFFLEVRGQQRLS
jgi:hypothetical protein